MGPEKTILGIDPGTQLLGFGVIRAVGKKASYVDMGILDLRKEKDAYSKLRAIHECISEVCKSYHPDELAIESPFYGKNAQVVLKLGRAQGAAIIAALQVQMMLEKTLGVTLESRHLDATDALAIALCHHYQNVNPLASAKGKAGWEKFLQEHPDRVKK